MHVPAYCLDMQGGEDDDFDMIAYIAKDKDTDVRRAFLVVPLTFFHGCSRFPLSCVCLFVSCVCLWGAEAHVFDCGSQSDQVLATVGQAFTLAQRSAEARRAQRKAKQEASAAGGPRTSQGTLATLASRFVDSCLTNVVCVFTS